MQETQSLQGLCRTCLAVEGCTFLDMSDAAVWRCEEFMNGHPTTTKTGKIGKGGRQRTSGADMKSARGMGICSSCEKLSGCTFPQAGIGVVYCEEYHRDANNR